MAAGIRIGYIQVCLQYMEGLFHGSDYIQFDDVEMSV